MATRCTFLCVHLCLHTVCAEHTCQTVTHYILSLPDKAAHTPWQLEGTWLNNSKLSFLTIVRNHSNFLLSIVETVDENRSKLVDCCPMWNNPFEKILDLESDRDPKNQSIVSLPKLFLPLRIHKNPSDSFWVILTDRQTNQHGWKQPPQLIWYADKCPATQV